MAIEIYVGNNFSFILRILSLSYRAKFKTFFPKLVSTINYGRKPNELKTNEPSLPPYST